jgi:hypothetical protein
MFQHSVSAASFACLAFSLVHCSGTPTEPMPAETRAVSAPLASSTGLPAYVHTPSRSRMALGPSATTSNDGPSVVRVRGDWAALTFDASTGHTLGVPSVGAPSLNREPWSLQLDLHNARVRDYFVSAGLPSAEVGAIAGHVGGGAGGALGEAPTQFEPMAYYTVLTRVAKGIVIADSVAWARINSDGDVVSEEIFWPAIPQAVLDEAVALSARLSDASAATTFRAPLPSGEGRVVIRHSSAYAGGPFEAFASFDVSVALPHGTTVTHHFDSTGAERRLPQERRAPPPRSQRR